MIRPFTSADLDAAAKIWLQGNLDAHPFIPAAYWERNFAAVREALPQANVLVDAENGQIRGFLGLIGDEIAGIFVERRFRSGGVGKRLLDAAKQRHSRLTLHVYRANTRALAFYLREGFVTQAEQTDESTGAPEFIMQWKR